MKTGDVTIPHQVLRIAVVTLLLGILFGLMVWFGTLPPSPERGAYPTAEDLGTDYDRYVGERVAVSGIVVETSPVIIASKYAPGETLRLTITDLSVDVMKGNQLRVYGVARPDHTIRATNAVVNPKVGQWYTWSVSFLAGLWVLGRIIRYWRFNRTAWTLEPREIPLVRHVDERIRRIIHQYGR